MDYWLMFSQYTRNVMIPLSFFCRFWQFINAVALLSIERHVLIFNEHWLLTQKGRILFHYLPISIISDYHILLYLAVYFLAPCDDVFD